MKIQKNIKPEFVDHRGEIIKLLDDGKTTIKSILLINSKAGTVRSNHYHKKDAHYLYIISGKMEYLEKPVKGRATKKGIVEAGQMIYTPPMMIHTTKFPVDTVFFTFSTRSRSQKNYEADTIRVPELK